MKGIGSGTCFCCCVHPSHLFPCFFSLPAQFYLFTVHPLPSLLYLIQQVCWDQRMWHLTAALTKCLLMESDSCSTVINPILSSSKIGLSVPSSRTDKYYNIFTNLLILFQINVMFVFVQSANRVIFCSFTHLLIT